MICEIKAYAGINTWADEDLGLYGTRDQGMTLRIRICLVRLLQTTCHDGRCKDTQLGLKDLTSERIPGRDGERQQGSEKKQLQYLRD